MIVAIDIGGTKTLVALFDSSEKKINETRFETPQKYSEFIKVLSDNLKTLKINKDDIVVFSAPGKLDRTKGIGIAFGNLPWKNVNIVKDIEKLTGATTLFENDANLAGLSEAHQIKPLPHRAVYITFSTGIGSGIITDGIIDPDMVDSEAGEMLFEHENHLRCWEEFASGKAIVKKYGKKASEIDDMSIWQKITLNFAIGIINICAVIEPDVIIIGGSVGSYFTKYQDCLIKNLREIKPPLVEVPNIIQAKLPEEAVIYGCVTLAKQYLNEQH